MQLIEISNLNYIYDTEPVLKNINLSYDNKDFLAIIGPNGGGKSTLVKLILGLLQNNECIKFNNINTKQIGYVPQNTFENPNFNIRVLDLVLMGLVGEKIFGFYSKADKTKALESLKKVGMEKFWDKRLSSLSGGEKQRVFIARALVAECKLIILDEPTASVDAKTAVQIFDLLSTLHKKEGIGIILICHDINLVLAYADKIAYLNQELFLHFNQKEKTKSDFIKHLSQEHQHFCAVEMSLNSCLCECLKDKNA